ncbi:MAG: hypothetical protein HYY06_09615 [Deltaproteobacteria bacterium]|nr:hypothetical protein [Deltaproteobacteria bacterium]
MVTTRIGFFATALAALGCGSDGGDRYVGTGTATVIPRDTGLEQQTRTNGDEEVRALRTSDGGIVLSFDGCELTTGPLRDGQASLPRGASCEGRTARGSARFTVTRGNVALWPGGDRLSLMLEGEGESTASGNRELVRYLYSFSGRRRE